MDSREIFAESGIITSSVSDGPMGRGRFLWNVRYGSEVL